MARGPHGLPDHGMLDGGQADLFFQKERVECGLPAHGNGSTNAGRLAQNRVFTPGIGQVVVVGKPQAGGRPGRTTGHRNAGWVKVPFLGLGAQELDGPGGIMNRSWEKLCAGKPIINGAIAVSLLESIRTDGLVLLAAQPAAAVDMDKQRHRLLRLNLPEIELHVLMGTVGDMLVSRLNVLGNERGCHER